MNWGLFVACPQSLFQNQADAQRAFNSQDIFEVSVTTALSYVGKRTAERLGSLCHLSSI